MFFFTFSQKMFKAFILLFGFILVFGSTSFYLCCFIYYGKRTRILTDNNQNSLPGLLLLLAQIGLRNFILGLLNSYLRSVDYFTMLGTLVSVDLLFMGLFVLSIRYPIYHSKVKMWVYVLLNFLKIMLILTLFFDYQRVC